MRLNIVLIPFILVIFAACFVTGCLGSGSAQITNVTTDKETYHAKEVMNIIIYVNSQEEMNNATLRLRGIQNWFGEHQLDHEISVNLSPGQNILQYEHEFTRCLACTDLLEGEYPFEVELIKNGVVISNTSHSIRLEYG